MVNVNSMTAPATPDNLTASNVGDGTSVNVSWNAVNGVDNYTVYWTDNASLAIDPDNASTYTGSATVTAPTTSATATGLTPGGNYDFTVIATNSSSTGSSSPATEVNLSTNPSVPTGLTATSPDNSTINLSWNASRGLTTTPSTGLRTRAPRSIHPILAPTPVLLRSLVIIIPWQACLLVATLTLWW